jgi:hypothetical protein
LPQTRVKLRLHAFPVGPFRLKASDPGAKRVSPAQKALVQGCPVTARRRVGRVFGGELALLNQELEIRSRSRVALAKRIQIKTQHKLYI